jgi:DNA-binding FadR family transcriptional regulator
MERSIARRNLDAFIRLDLAVHTRLAELSGNARLGAIIVSLGEDIRRFGTYSISVRDRERASLDEHRRLLRAVWTGDAHTAARSMFVHLVNTRKTIRALGAAHGGQPRRAAIRASHRRRTHPPRHRGSRRLHVKGG